MLTMCPCNDSDSPMMQMGTPGGHILPGVLFILWGIWTVLVAWTKYHSSVQEYITKCHPVPIDKKITRGKRMVRIFFFAAPVIGMLGEAISGTISGWTYEDIQNNIQHIVMFGSFALHMGLDLWMPQNTCDTQTRENINYLTLSIAFGSEAYLFGNHLHGRTLLDRKLHTCLTIAILANTISVAAEAVMSRSKVLPAIVRGCMTAWQGTWFLHIAIVNWPLPIVGDALVWSSTDSHANAMLTDTLFIGHLLAIVSLALISGQYIGLKVGRSSPQADQDFGMNNNYKRLSTNSHQKEQFPEEGDGLLEEEIETA